MSQVRVCLILVIALASLSVLIGISVSIAGPYTAADALEEHSGVRRHARCAVAHCGLLLVDDGPGTLAAGRTWPWRRNRGRVGAHKLLKERRGVEEGYPTRYPARRRRRAIVWCNSPRILRQSPILANVVAGRRLWRAWRFLWRRSRC